MPLPWTAGRQKQEQKKLQCSAGWVGYPALTEEVSLHQARTATTGHPRFVFQTTYVYLSTAEVRIVDRP